MTKRSRNPSAAHADKIKELKEEGLGVADIAVRLSLTSKQVRYRLKRLQVKMGPAGTRRMFTDEQEAEICCRYRDKKHHVWTIAEGNRCSTVTVYKVLRRNKIAIRRPDLSEAARRGGEAAAVSKRVEGLFRLRGLVASEPVKQATVMEHPTFLIGRPAGTKGSGRAQPQALRLRFPPLPGEPGYEYRAR